ncbi:MAG: cation-translocating P-type ATPase [Candidatus Lokiarchaeota archaeon]|nr:cation-translocating P-type ATPase [Candidatus Lokiarchaeota archaeon]
MSESISSHKMYHALTAEELASEFETNLNIGLSSSKLDERYLKHGFNELPKIKKSLWKIYLAPIFNILIVILIFTGIFVILLGEYGSALFTFAIVIVNSITVIIQQFRAQKALDSLRKIAALKTTVLRDGIQYEIPTKEIVPGDIVLLKQGDKIPADGRVIETVNLSVDEAPLTGESEAVEKKEDILEKIFLPIQKQSNVVFMGTYVNTGRGKIIIYGTGTNTEIGKISTQLNEMGSIEDIPLTRKLNRLGYILSSLLILILIILIIYKFIILSLEGNFYGHFISEALVSSILRSMNVMPINLPLLSTLVLVTGVLNMAQSGVIVKNLAAIESLGRVSIICSDKTGTITRNEMCVNKFWLNELEYDVTGSGYESNGKILLEGEEIDLKENPTFQKLIDSSIINNTAKLIYEDVKVRMRDQKEIAVRRANGSPTESALLVLAEKADFITYDVKNKYDVIKEFSFTSELKRMSTVCELKDKKGEYLVFTKGAPEKILELSAQVELNGALKPISERTQKEIQSLISIRANQGYRTLAIAYKPINKENDLIRERIESDLIFLGFFSILDPVRPGVQESVSKCEAGGINVIMITGDHPKTAQTIAAQSRIYKKGDLVVEGSEIRNLSDEDFEKVTVFARVAPTDKEVIVERYQGQNGKKKHVVAMTGDGINDILALKLADAGIAMGITGTDVSKEIADLVISDDDFTSIEKGVRIGRGLFAKIRNIIFFFICLNLMEAAVFLTYEFIPTFNLFASEWQHVYIYVIVHSLPSIALVIDSHPKDVMLEPPRDEQQLLNRNMWIMLVLQAFLIGMGLVFVLQFTLGGLFPLNEWNYNPILSYLPPGSTPQDLLNQKARTMLITTIYIVETTFIWSFRRPNKSIVKSIKEEFNVSLFLICTFTLGIHILHINFSYAVNTYVNDIWGLDFQINFLFLSGLDWLVCILFALPGIVGIEIFKKVARSKNMIF